MSSSEGTAEFGVPGVGFSASGSRAADSPATTGTSDSFHVIEKSPFREVPDPPGSSADQSGSSVRGRGSCPTILEREKSRSGDRSVSIHSSAKSPRPSSIKDRGGEESSRVFPSEYDG